jgi:hypothetical protein
MNALSAALDVLYEELPATGTRETRVPVLGSLVSEFGNLGNCLLGNGRSGLLCHEKREERVREINVT